MKVLFFLALFGLALARPSYDPAACAVLYKGASLSTNYNETIAHAVHSMNVQGLKMFSPRATEHNRIPTVNLDRSSAEKVLPYAPNFPTGSDFSTQTMNIIDRILSHIGNAKDGLGPNWSPIERVVHTFHMWDLWNQVHRVFTKDVRSNPPSNDLCACLMNTRENGIYKAVKWVSDHYDSGTPITLLNRPIPKLTDSESWDIWKYRLLYYYDNTALHDAAKFLYCAVKEF